MLLFLMKQILMAIEKEKILTYLTFSDNRPESFTPFSETRDCVTKNFYTAKTDTILKKKLTRAVPSVTIESETCK